MASNQQCGRCGRPRCAGKICTACLSRQRDLQRRLRARLRELGLCQGGASHGPAVPGRSSCSGCLAKASKQSSQRYRRNKRNRVCRVCGETTTRSLCKTHAKYQARYQAKRRLQPANQR